MNNPRMFSCLEIIRKAAEQDYLLDLLNLLFPSVSVRLAKINIHKSEYSPI